MWQFVAILLVIAMAVVVLKLAIIAAFCLGIIFRTKETLGLLLILGAFALADRFPAAALILLVVVIAIALLKWMKAPDKPVDVITDQQE